jgi:MFS family permease
MCRVQGPGFFRFLYNQNPFYLISAAVVLYGFQTATQEAGFAANPWILAGLFAGYTALLALTAWVIVRFGRVWDDARSILVVLLLLFMALSASLDGLFISQPETALAIATAGFAFAIVVSELLVWSLEIRFRALFRGPLYAMLATSFFYPILFSIQKTHWPELDHRYIILGFPFAVSLTILSLVPAIRKTKSYVAKNGTPWNWPLYPYSIFVLAIVGLVGRTVMLGLSFDPSIANGMLGTWMFVPIFLSVMWLLFEFGSAEKNEDLQLLAMILMPFSLGLALAWPFFSNADFYFQITQNFGSPVWLTLLALVVIYTGVWIDKVESASVFLTLSLVGVMLIQRDGSMVEEFASLQAWPCVPFAIWSLASRKRFKSCACWLLTSCFVSIPVAQLLSPLLKSHLQPVVSNGIEAAVAFHFVLLCSCMLAGIFSGKFSKQMKVLLATVLPVLAVLVVAESIFHPRHAQVATIYAATMSILGFFIFVAAKSRLHLSAAAISMGACLLAALPMLEQSVGETNSKLINTLGAGIACFLVGLWVSAVKAGWTRKMNSGFGKLKLEFLEAFPSPAGNR